MDVVVVVEMVEVAVVETAGAAKVATKAGKTIPTGEKTPIGATNAAITT